MVKYKYDAWGKCKAHNANSVEITDDTHNEYNFHMYAWVGLKGWFGGSGILGTLAGTASEANVEANDPFYDYNYYIEKGDAFNAYLRTALYLAVGVLGL